MSSFICVSMHRSWLPDKTHSLSLLHKLLSIVNMAAISSGADVDLQVARNDELAGVGTVCSANLQSY